MTTDIQTALIEAGFIPAPKPKVLTPEEVKQRFIDRGECITEWARKNGFCTAAVYQVLNGFLKGNRGTSHKIAVALGLKAAPKNSQE